MPSIILAPEIIRKTPTEDYVVTLDFSGKLDGDTIASVETPATLVEKSPAGAEDLTLAPPSFSGQLAQVRISGGTVGANYVVMLAVFGTEANERFEGAVRVEVRE